LNNKWAAPIQNGFQEEIDSFVTSMRNEEIPDVAFCDDGPSELYRHVRMSPSQWLYTLGANESPYKTITVCGVYTFYKDADEGEWSEYVLESLTAVGGIGGRDG